MVDTGQKEVGEIAEKEERVQRIGGDDHLPWEPVGATRKETWHRETGMKMTPNWRNRAQNSASS